MQKPCRSRKSVRLAARLTVALGLAAGLGVGAATVPTATAAIVGIDIGPSGFNIGGINAGLSPEAFVSINNFPFAGAGTLFLRNRAAQKGLASLGGQLQFAAGESSASPRNFTLNDSIDSSANFTGSGARTQFYFVDTASPDFGPGSYMGFRTGTGNYGWLEVTWNSAANEFEILSGAYEDQVGVAILAGNTGAAVPEPGTWAAAALLAGGATFARWRKRRDAAQKEAA